MMKNKKMWLPTVILLSAILVSVACTVIGGIAKKPVITEHEFPFSITYELDGETVVISDVYSARYDRNDGYADTKSRVYVGKIEGMEEEEDTWYELRKDADGRIVLNTKLYADYMMGDTEYDYFERDSFEPQILYYDMQEVEYSDEETLASKGVKLISWEYPQPIENSFVFSHISYANGNIVFANLIVGYLTVIAILIFVKKEAELKYGVIDVISIVLNFIVSLACVPVFAFFGWFSDVIGGSGEFFHQLLYFIPLISLLTVGLSVALRRKGYGKSSLLVQFVGPVLFALYLIIPLF